MPIPNVSPTGVTVIEVMLGAETVREVDPETPPNEAEIVAGPAATPVINPEALTVATFVAEEAQVTSVVKSALLPSL
jgi:hypothetical protein